MAETTVRLTIYGCPHSARPALWHRLILHGLDTPQGASQPDRRLRIGTCYVNPAGDSATARELLGLLTGISSDARFTVSAAPAGGQQGSWVAYTPALGSFEGRCDPGGEVTLTAFEITAITQATFEITSATAASHTAGPVLAHRLAAATGQPWRD
jgi:hypothetical protein